MSIQLTDEDFVFTIDPSTSTDYDDAMSIKEISQDKRPSRKCCRKFSRS